MTGGHDGLREPIQVAVDAADAESSAVCGREVRYKGQDQTQGDAAVLTMPMKAVSKKVVSRRVSSRWVFQRLRK